MDTLKIFIAHYVQKIKKVRASARPKCRASVEELESLVDYVAMMRGVMAEAKKVHPTEHDIHEALKKAMLSREYYDEMVLASTNKMPNFKLAHLSVWHEIVDMHMQVKATGPRGTTSIEALQEVTADARYQDWDVK